MESQVVIVHGEKIFIDKKGILALRRKNITEVAQIIGLENLVGLKVLDLSFSKNFKSFNFSTKNLDTLQELNLRSCVLLKSLPDNLCELKSLRKFNLRGCKSLSSLQDYNY